MTAQQAQFDNGLNQILQITIGTMQAGKNIFLAFTPDGHVVSIYQDEDGELAWSFREFVDA